MTISAAPDPAPNTQHADPTIAVAELQLAVLNELVQMGLAVTRGQAAAALAASNAVEVILADEYWQPETGRARALAGSRDATQAYHKAARSLRLTLALQFKTAETLRDLRAGIITNSNARRQDAGEMLAMLGSAVELDRRRPAGTCSDETDPLDVDKPERDFERLVEFDRPDRLPRAPFRETVDSLCADIGVAPDWANWKIGRPKADDPAPAPRSPDKSEHRPPGAIPSPDVAETMDRETSSSP